MLLPHPHRKQQTWAAVMRNRRRKGDHWWWYPMWLGWVKTSGVCAGSSTSEMFLPWTLCSILTKVKDTYYLLVSNPMWYSCGQVYTGETRWRLETRLKEQRDSCGRGVMEKSAVAEHEWENYHPIYWARETTVLDHGRGQEPLVKDKSRWWRRPCTFRWHSQRNLQPRCCDEEAGREEQSSPTFDLQWQYPQLVLRSQTKLLYFRQESGYMRLILSSVWLQIAAFVHTSFTFALMTIRSIQSKHRQVIFQAQVGNR